MKQIILTLDSDFRLERDAYAKMYELENGSTEILIKTKNVREGMIYELHKEQGDEKTFVFLNPVPEGLSYIVESSFISKAGNACLQIRATDGDVAIESNIIDFRIGRFINATEPPIPPEPGIIERLVSEVNNLTEKLNEIEEDALFLE